MTAGQSESARGDLPVCDRADPRLGGNRCDGGLVARGPRCGSGAGDEALSQWSSAFLFSCSGWISPGRTGQAAQVKGWSVENVLFHKTVDYY